MKLLCCFFFLIFCLVVASEVSAKDGGLTLRAEHHWETYGVGGTCNHGMNNLFLGDVDNDDIVEIISGGFQYYKDSEGIRGPMDIMVWENQDVTVEKTEKWPGTIEVVYVADADGDGIDEIFTAGILRNDTGSYYSLRVWHWMNDELSLKAHYEGHAVTSIFVSDVDKDGTAEIITAGILNGYDTSEICLWHLEEKNLALKENVKLTATNIASVNAYDLDNNGDVEIITGGYSEPLNNSKGELSIWEWNGEELSLKTDEKWQMLTDCYALDIVGGVLGNTVVNNLKVGDIDGDSTPEIVTGGFTYDGEKVKSQLIVWNWNGSSLTQKFSQEWATETITLVYSVSLNDVDKDSSTEIVTGGMTSNKAELTVWAWERGGLTLEHTADWLIGDGVCVWNVETADLDNDGVAEIVTEGCMSYNNLCDPDLRIWSINLEVNNSMYILLATAFIVLVVALTTVLIYRSKIDKS